MKEFVQFMMNLGPTVMLPVFIFILAIILRGKVSTAFRSALTIGIGFVGLNLVIGLLVGALGPATNELIKHTGVHLQAIDVGWGVLAAIAFGTTVGALIVPLAFGINLLMLFLKLTKTLNVDMWNFWHYAFTGSMAYLVSHNLAIGLIAAAIHVIVALKFADLTAKPVQKFFGLPGISITQGWAITSIPIVLIVNKIIDLIPGVRNIKADTEVIEKRLGVFGEPAVLGLILGILLGLAAGYGVSDTLKLSISMAAVMLLVPRIIKIFMEGLIPVSEAAKEFMERRFKGREFYIGLDSALLIGHPITIAAGILLIPVTLTLAVILPGNHTLPFADLGAMAFYVCMAPVFTKGNLFRTVVIGAVIMVIVLYISTNYAPLITTTAQNIGYKMPDNSSVITAMSSGNWVAWILTKISSLF